MQHGDRALAGQEGYLPSPNFLAFDYEKRITYRVTRITIWHDKAKHILRERRGPYKVKSRVPEGYMVKNYRLPCEK